MREEETQIIGGKEWKVYPWPAMYGLKIQSRLAPILSKAFAQGEGKDLMNLDISQVASGLLGSIDEEKTPKLLRDTLHGVRVEGKDVSLDRHFDELFCGNYAELYQGIFFVLKVNFGDLFTQAAGIGNRVAKNQKSAE